ATVAMLMMAPSLRSIICGSTALIVCTCAQRLRSRANSSSLSGISRIEPLWTIPAQLKSTSMRPISSTAAKIASRSSTLSTRVVRLARPSNSRSLVSLMSVAMTLAPARANASADARPMPCAAAVTTTILPLRSAMLSSNPSFSAGRPGRPSAVNASRAFDDLPVDLVEIPVDTKAWRVARYGAARAYGHAGRRDRVELGNIFDPACIGHGGAERNMQFHEEVRRDRDVERFGHMGHLEPGCDTADAADIDLHDRAGVPLQIFAKVRGRIKAFTHGDGQTRVIRQPAVPLDVVGRQRFFEPADIERLVMAGAADRFVDGEGLVGVGEDLEAVADRIAYRGDAGDVFADRPANFQLRAAKALGPGPQRVLDQRLLLEMQPAALGGIEANGWLRAAGEQVQRQAEL